MASARNGKATSANPVIPKLLIVLSDDPLILTRLFLCKYSQEFCALSEIFCHTALVSYKLHNKPEISVLAATAANGAVMAVTMASVR